MHSARPFRIAAIVDEFALGNPGQQLVDRFLFGYPTDAQFVAPHSDHLIVYAKGGPQAPSLLEARAKLPRDRGRPKLEIAQGIEPAVEDADAVLVCSEAMETPPRDLVSVLEHCRPGARVFVPGVLALDGTSAAKITAQAAKRGIELRSGTCIATTWRLPPIRLPQDLTLAEALVATVGSPAEAQLLGVESLLAVAGEAGGAGLGVRRVVAFIGPQVWAAQKRQRWSVALLAAALSRSDTPLGDAVTDGRTQDLVRLGLVEKLAREPVAFCFELVNGRRATILVLNGVVRDINFAVESESGRRWSAQLYRPPAPNEHHWSTLAAVVDRYFMVGTCPWPRERGVAVVELLESMRAAADQPGKSAARSGCGWLMTSA